MTFSWYYPYGRFKSEEFILRVVKELGLVEIIKELPLSESTPLCAPCVFHNHKWRLNMCGERPARKQSNKKREEFYIKPTVR